MYKKARHHSNTWVGENMSIMLKGGSGEHYSKVSRNISINSSTFTLNILIQTCIIYINCYTNLNICHCNSILRLIHDIVHQVIYLLNAHSTDYVPCNKLATGDWSHDMFIFHQNRYSVVFIEICWNPWSIPVSWMMNRSYDNHNDHISGKSNGMWTIKSKFPRCAPLFFAASSTTAIHGSSYFAWTNSRGWIKFMEVQNCFDACLSVVIGRRDIHVQRISDWGIK